MIGRKEILVKRFIGTQKVIVRVLNVEFGVVEPGEAIVVPDELAKKVKWSHRLWEDVMAAGIENGAAEDKETEE